MDQRRRDCCKDEKDSVCGQLKVQCLGRTLIKASTKVMFAYDSSPYQGKHVRASMFDRRKSRLLHRSRMCTLLKFCTFSVG